MLSIFFCIPLPGSTFPDIQRPLKTPLRAIFLPPVGIRYALPREEIYPTTANEANHFRRGRGVARAQTERDPIEGGSRDLSRQRREHF